MNEPLGLLRIGDKLRQSNHVSRYQVRTALRLQKKKPELLGILLTNLGFIPSSDLPLKEINSESPPNTLRLGAVLLHQKWLTEEQLASALLEQHETEEELGALLLRKGWLDPHRLESALTELILGRSHNRKQRLGQILVHTHQLSDWQLNQALKQKREREPLGQTLLRLQWLCPKQISQALRLQKKLLRSISFAFLGASLLVACQAPTVPLQFAEAGNLNAPPVYRVQTQASLNGAFKTLAVDSSGQHSFKIRVYQNGSKVIENVPFFRQGRDNTCGQAVVAMVTNFWGLRTNYQELVNQENPLNLATSAGMLTNSFREKGLVAQDFRKGSLDSIIYEVNQGRPTPVLLDFGNIQSAHYVVVLGYNTKKGTLIIHDSLEGPYVEMEEATFLKMWENKSVRGILPVGADNYQRLMFRVFHQEIQNLQ
jgi:hypothetical protein